MSHFSEVKTSLRNQRFLERALSALGYSFELAQENCEVGVRGFFGDTVSAHIRIDTGTRYDVGLRKQDDGSFSLVGDWELLPKVAGIEREAFESKLKREYAKQAILSTAEEKGYSVEVVENGENIEMVVNQWGS